MKAWMTTVTAILIALMIVVCLHLHDTDFSSPSSVATASDKSAVVIISCLDLQRELNRRHPDLTLVEDGICGPATMAAWNEEVFNGYALELWPEDAK